MAAELLRRDGRSQRAAAAHTGNRQARALPVELMVIQ